MHCLEDLKHLVQGLVRTWPSMHFCFDEAISEWEITVLYLVFEDFLGSHFNFFNNSPSHLIHKIFFQFNFFQYFTDYFNLQIELKIHRQLLQGVKLTCY